MRLLRSEGNPTTKRSSSRLGINPEAVESRFCSPGWVGQALLAGSITKATGGHRPTAASPTSMTDAQTSLQ